jgi:hypothetical protein
MNVQLELPMTLPALPRIALAQCRAKPAMAKTFLRVVLTYLKAAAEFEHSPAMLATFGPREDADEPLTDYSYALECAHATTSYLTNDEISVEQAAVGFFFEVAETQDPFQPTEAGKTQFMRPLAFASIFGPGWGARKVFDEKAPARYLHAKNPLTGDWFEYWGPELRQEDLSVLLWFAKQNEGKRPGSYIDFDAKKLLADIGRTVHVKNLEWLFNSAIRSLERANLVLFNAQTGHRKAYGLLKTEFHYDKNEAGDWVFSLRKSHGRFRLDPDYRSLLALHDGMRQTYLIDLDVRKNLAAKPLALWLQMFVSAHLANPAIRNPGQFTRDVSTLKAFCYGEDADNINDKEFSRRLKEAAQTLEQQGVIKRGNIWRGKATFEAVDEVLQAAH